MGSVVAVAEVAEEVVVGVEGRQPSEYVHARHDGSFILEAVAGSHVEQVGRMPLIVENVVEIEAHLMFPTVSVVVNEVGRGESPPLIGLKIVVDISRIEFVERNLFRAVQQVVGRKTQLEILEQQFESDLCVG